MASQRSFDSSRVDDSRSDDPLLDLQRVFDLSLDLMCIAIDDIVERAILQIDKGEIDQSRSAAVTLAADQAHRAIADRRAMLKG